MENQQPEALALASLLENMVLAFGENRLFSRARAAKELRRLHARVEELEKDRGNAKRLVSKIWNQHPEARGTIEEGTGAWLVFGQDVETGGVSAQRVTQAKDHIAQPPEMVAAPVVLPEPIGTVGAAPGTSGFTLTVFEAARVPVGTNIYTEQQVRELLATGSQPQADARDNLLAALENLLASITGGQKQCGHDFDCVCPEDQARAAIAAAKEL